MPQFQIIVVATACIALLTNWLVFSGTSFSIGMAPILAIGFLASSIGLVFWTFFTPSGKSYALEYNKVQEQKAAMEREEIKQTKIVFNKDMEFIKQDKTSAQQDPLLQSRIVLTLKKQIVDAMGIRKSFLETFTVQEKSSSLQLLISIFPENQELQDIAIQEVFNKDINFIRQNRDKAQKDQKLELRIISNLEKDATNIIGQRTTFFNTLSKQDKRSTLQTVLSTFVNNSKLQEFAFSQMQQGWLPSDQAYALALQVLAENPDQPKAKQLVLQVGRYHFGKLRKGKVTIYDEQSIQNDIQVRLK